MKIPPKTKLTYQCSKFEFCRRIGPGKNELDLKRTHFAKPPPPFGLSLFKGVKNVLIERQINREKIHLIVVSPCFIFRDFSSFLLFHPVAREFRSWLESAIAPEEYFFATLAR